MRCLPAARSSVLELHIRHQPVVFLLDPQVSLPSLEKLLSTYRIGLNSDVIIDPYSRVFVGDVTSPAVSQYENHPITKNFNFYTFFPYARSIRILDEERDGVTIQYLAKTGKTAYGETDLESVARGQVVMGEEDIEPPLPVAAIASKRIAAGDALLSEALESTIVVFGDSDFASNRAFRLSGNSDFLLNVINFLAEEKDLIAIRPKKGMGDVMFLTASQGRLIFLLSTAIAPTYRRLRSTE